MQRRSRVLPPSRNRYQRLQVAGLLDRPEWRWPESHRQELLAKQLRILMHTPKADADSSLRSAQAQAEENDRSDPAHPEPACSGPAR